MKRFFLFAFLGALLALFLTFTTLVNAAPPIQDVPTETPKPTRDPIKVATRRATRGLPPRLTPEPAATPIPDVAQPEAAAVAAPAVVPSPPGPMTSRILIFNPDTSGAATVKIDIFDSSGQIAYTTIVNVPPNGALPIALLGSLGTSFQGGAQLSSDKNVQAIVVGSNSSNTARDSYEGTISPAQDVVLPFVRHLAVDTQNTVIAVQNTTNLPANVSVTFYRPDGSTATQQNLILSANQSSFLNTNTLFPGSTFTGSARIVSNQNVAVAAQTLYYKDTAAFDGANAVDATPVLFVNHIRRKVSGAGAGQHWSEIFVRNNGGNATNVTLDIYSISGVLITSSTSTVPPNGMAQFLLTDAAFAALGNNFSGWAKISSGGEPVSATALQALAKGKRLYSINALASGGVGIRYVCGDIARMATQNSRISILNTDDAATAKAFIRLYDPVSGAKISQTKVKIPPNNSTNVFLSDVKFAPAGANYQGMAIVLAKGTNPPKLVVSVNNPYGSPKVTAMTGYGCSPI